MSENQPPEGFDPQEVSLKGADVQDEAEEAGEVEVAEIGAYSDEVEETQ